MIFINPFSEIFNFLTQFIVYMNQRSPTLLILRVRAFKKDIILPQRIDFVYPVLISSNVYNIKFFDIQPRRAFGYYLGYLIAFILSIPKLIFMDYDFVFIENPYLSFFAPFISIRRKKILVEFVDYYPSNLLRLYKEKHFRYTIAILISRTFHLFYTKIITESITTKKTLESLGVPAEKLEIIPVAIDTEKFVYNLSSRKKIRMKYSLNENYILGYLGKLVEYYNLSILPKIISKLNSDKELNHIKFSLLIIGDGPFKKTLEEEVVDLRLYNVTFTGNIPYNQINEYYSSMDLFIFPLDSLAIKVGEVLSMGLPIVVPRGMPEDWIIDKNNGIIAKNQTVDAFVEAIKEYLNLDDTLKKEIASNGRKFAKSNLERKKITFKYIKILNTL
ncbi:MAG: GDP-mannose-dependent alpha-(1-6)-phosphatidylinositol monomannoside mannosyltransferase [Candidatus Heimdallarchaeota archaeon LC_3]|nr:MAG: GDP-mannose-dependent alpha-(1-6)-phosphatidylinositol monomannoside mannosyltransferase [Candidatus Heimdallarchaeota archaeon LC_3]